MDVSNDSVTVAVGELNGESLESVAFGHVVLYALLKFSRCKVASTNAFKFIVGKSSGEKIAELRVPLSVQIVLVSPQTAHLLLQDALEQLLFLNPIECIAWHKVAYCGIWSQRVDVLWTHCFPKVLVFQVKLSVDDSIIGLDVSEEGFVRENASHCSVETMHSGVVIG